MATTRKPISLLCSIGIKEDTLSSELLDILDHLFDSQDEAITAYIDNDPTAPRLTSHRGLFLFQQIEDKRIVLGSGQWPATGPCEKWFATAWPERFHAELEPHYRTEDFEAILMEDLIFPEAGSDDETALSNASRLEITRWRVATDKRDQFQSAVESLRAKRKGDDQKCTTFGAWRLDDWPVREDSSTVQEYFMVANRDALGTAGKEEAACSGLAISVEVKHYEKAV